MSGVCVCVYVSMLGCEVWVCLGCVCVYVSMLGCEVWVFMRSRLTAFCLLF